MTNRTKDPIGFLIVLSRAIFMDLRAPCFLIMAIGKASQNGSCPNVQANKAKNREAQRKMPPFELIARPTKTNGAASTSAVMFWKSPMIKKLSPRLSIYSKNDIILISRRPAPIFVHILINAPKEEKNSAVLDNIPNRVLIAIRLNTSGLLIQVPAGPKNMAIRPSMTKKTDMRPKLVSVVMKNSTPAKKNQ